MGGPGGHGAAAGLARQCRSGGDSSDSDGRVTLQVCPSPRIGWRLLQPRGHRNRLSESGSPTHRAAEPTSAVIRRRRRRAGAGGAGGARGRARVREPGPCAEDGDLVGSNPLGASLGRVSWIRREPPSHPAWAQHRVRAGRAVLEVAPRCRGGMAAAMVRRRNLCGGFEYGGYDRAQLRGGELRGSRMRGRRGDNDAAYCSRSWLYFGASLQKINESEIFVGFYIESATSLMDSTSIRLHRTKQVALHCCLFVTGIQGADGDKHGGSKRWVS